MRPRYFRRGFAVIASFGGFQTIGDKSRLHSLTSFWTVSPSQRPGATVTYRIHAPMVDSGLRKGFAMKRLLGSLLLGFITLAPSYPQTSQDLQHQAGSATNHQSPSPKPHSYTNSDGQRIQSPTKAPSAPAGSTALCRDGSWSFSQHRQGTCSHHGGVAKWIQQ